MQKLRVGYVCCARLSFSAAFAKDTFHRSLKSLSKLDVELIHGADLTVTEQDAEALADKFQSERVDVLVVQYGTFALGTIIPIFADRLNIPVVLWAVPEPTLNGPRLESNSFCGINMNAHTLMRLGRKYDYVFCSPEEGPDKLKPILRVLGCLRNLRRTKIGLVEYRVPGFYTSTFDEMGLRRLLGVEVHQVTLAELADVAKSIDPARRAEEAKAIRASAKVCTASPEEIDKAAALYLAFREVAEKNRLTSYAVKCWPEFAAHYGIMPCSTISRLTDSGMLTACEGDVYGAVTMLMANFLSEGKTPMFADFIAADASTNVGIAWHCGAAPSCIAAKGAKITLGKHPTVGGGGKTGVNISFPIEGKGPVTMCRLSVGPKGLRMFIAGGKAVPPKAKIAGNCWGVKFDRPVPELLDIIIRQGLEHHTALVHSDIRDELRSLARWINLETLDVDAKS